MMSAVKQKAVSTVLVVCMVLAAALGMSGRAEAAEAGYSPLYSMYEITGVDGKQNIVAIAYLYGSKSNQPKDNFAEVYKVKVTSDYAELLCDVMDGEQFNALLGAASSSEQVTVDEVKAYLKEIGAPKAMMIEDEAPYAYRQIERQMLMGTTDITMRNAGVIHPDTLRYAAKNGVKQLNFDSTVNKAVNVRISLDPSTATKGFFVEANAEDSGDDLIMQKLRGKYKNTLRQVDMLQIGSFGTQVKVSAKVDLKGMDTSSLVFYSYDSFSGKFTLIENPNYSVGDDGYLHFQTSLGGKIVISEKALAKR